jgi:hypothetical protein
MNRFQPSCTYTDPTCFSRTIANTSLRKAIQTSSLLHGDWSIHLSSHLVFYEPPHRYTYDVDPNLRMRIHDFPRRSDNAIVEFLVNQRFDRVDFCVCSLVSFLHARYEVCVVEALTRALQCLFLCSFG